MIDYAPWQIRQRGFLGQTFTRVIHEEDGNAAWAAVRDHVSRDATVFADEHGTATEYVELIGSAARLNEGRPSLQRHLLPCKRDVGIPGEARSRPPGIVDGRRRLWEIAD